MRPLAHARALIGTHAVSAAGGRTRYLTLEPDGADVIGLLYGNEIIRWREATVQLWTRGHPTPSTFDALAWALDVGRIGVGTTARVPYVLGHVLREGIMLDDTTGAVVREGDALHLAPGRGGGDLAIESVAPSSIHGDVVWTRSTGTSRDVVRRTAAAAAGRPRARTRVLSAANGPYGSTLCRVLVLP